MMIVLVHILYRYVYKLIVVKGILIIVLEKKRLKLETIPLQAKHIQRL